MDIDLISGSGGCFTANTKILTPNGYINISDIRIGMEVIAFDDKGELHTSKVTSTSIHNNYKVFKYTFWGGIELIATPNHWVLNSENYFSRLDQLNETLSAVTTRGLLAPLISVEFVEETVVYNLIVETYHTYIANDIRVHNGGGGKGGGHTPIEAPDNLKSKSYAEVLDLLCEGEIVGLVNGTKSIYINDTPVQNTDGSYNYTDFTYIFRNGTQTQDYIPGFDTAESEQAGPGVIKKAIPKTVSIVDPTVDRVRVTLGIDGLVKYEDNGDTNGSSIQYTISINKNGGSFTEVVKRTITGKTTSKYQISHIVVLPRFFETDSFTIKVTRITDDSTTLKLQNGLYFDSYTQIVDTKLRYPNSVLCGIKISSEQFTSIPKRGYHVKLLKVKIPSNYNPETRVYSGIWDGTFSYAWTNNPAWCYYDLITNERYGLGEYIGADHIDKWSLYTIAQYCDELVPNGFGGTEPRFSLNAYIQTREDAIKLLMDIASSFRGMVYWSGSTITLAQDSDSSDPILQFTNSNVINGLFTYSGASRKVIHTAALVSWNDPEALYEQKIEYVEDREAIQRYGYNPTEIVAFGCTSRGQAHRAGKWILYTEKVESNVVSFSTGLDSAYCKPGDIIKIFDETITGIQYSGRIHTSPLRSNLLKYSEALGNATAWTVLNGIASKTDNFITTTEGISATKLVYSGTSDPYIGQILETNNSIIGTTYTFSIYAWTTSGQITTGCNLYLYDSSISYIGSTAITLTTTPTRYTVTYTFPVGSIGTKVYARFDPPNAGTSSNYCYAGGAQLEKSSSAGDYLKTTTLPQFTVKLDRDITLGSGQYDIRFNSLFKNFIPNKTITNYTDYQSYGDLKTLSYDIVSILDSSNILLLNGIPDDYVQSGTIWSIYSNTLAEKLFRMVSIKESDSVGIYDITAILHDPAKFDYIENNIELPVREYSTLSSLPEQISYSSVNLRDDIYINSSGNISTYLSMSFTQPLYAVYYSVEIRKQNGSWEMIYANSQNNNITIYGLADNTIYDIRVVPYNIMKKPGKELTIYNILVRGKYNPPSNVTTLNAYVSTVDKSSFILNWSNSSDLDFSEYEIRYGSSWDSAIEPINVKTTTISVPIKNGNSHTWLIKAIDTTKNYSTNATSTTLSIANPPAPTLDTPVLSSTTGECTITWSVPTTDLKIAYYELYYGADESSITLLTKTTATSYILAASWSSRKFWLRTVDIAGNTSSSYSTAISEVVAPSIPTIDNINSKFIGSNYELKWTGTAGSIPIKEYIVSYGSTIISTLSSTSIQLPINWIGSRTFSVVAKDLAGNTSTAATKIVDVVAPGSITWLSNSYIGKQLKLSWNTPSIGSLPIDYYEIKRGSDWGSGVSLTKVYGNSILIDVNWSSSATFFIKAVDINGNIGDISTSNITTISSPGSTTPISNFNNSNVEIKWSATALGSLPIDKYEIREGGTTWETATFIGFSSDVKFITPVNWSSSTTKTYWVNSIDTAGNYGTSGSTSITFSTYSAVTNLLSSVKQTDLILSWDTALGGSLPIDYYDVRFGYLWDSGEKISKVYSNTLTVPITWTTRKFWVAPVDIKGNYGPQTSIISTIGSAGQPSVTSSIILAKTELNWTAPSTVLPIKEYEIRYGTESIDFDFSKYQSLDDRVSFTRNSIATYIGSDGLLKTAQANQPRFEYDYSGNLLGLLIEESRTNLLLYTENFNDSGWIKQTGTTVTQVSNEIWTVDLTSASVNTGLYRQSSTTIAANTTASISIEMRVASTSGNNTVAIADPTGIDGTVSGSGTKTLTTSWQRFTFYITNSTTPRVRGIWIQKLTGGATSIQIRAPQVEVGTFATSYIPSTSIQGIRQADNFSMSSISSWYNNSASTIFVDYNKKVTTATSTYPRIISFYGTLSPRDEIALYNSSTTNYSALDVVTGGTGLATLSTVSFTQSSGIKIAAGLATNNCAVSFNGSTVISDNTVTLPSITSMSLGSYNSGNYLNGYIKRFMYWPVRLTDSQLKDLTSDSLWSSSNLVASTLTTNYRIPISWVRKRNFYIAAKDTSDTVGLYGTTESFVNIPSAPSISYEYVLDQIKLKWTDSVASLPIEEYEIRYGDSTSTWQTATVWGRSKSTTISTKVDWSNTRIWYIAAVDVNYNYGHVSSQNINITVPLEPTVTTQVIDNTVLLYWSSTKGTLPIETYEIRKGPSWSSAVLIGTKAGGFTTVFETTGGLYTYWIAGIDTAGNVGTPCAITTTVTQPPDYVLKADTNSIFNGTLSNAKVYEGSLYLNIDNIETWATHFTSRGWDQPIDQIGTYPYYIQPGTGSGYYEEVVAYEQILAASKVTITLTGEIVVGTPSINVDISISSDNTTWTTYNSTREVYATNFRYVKFRITTTGTSSIYKISNINIKLDAKLKNDAGSITCVQSDTYGTVANFTTDFLDITSISVSPSSTTFATAVYDFKDTIIDGTYTISSNIATISATAHNLVVGQKVKLGIVSGNGITGIYTVTAIDNVNQFKVAMVATNDVTSKSLTVYAQGFRIYLYDITGARISGTVSWSVKGY